MLIGKRCGKRGGRKSRDWEVGRIHLPSGSPPVQVLTTMELSYLFTFSSQSNDPIPLVTPAPASLQFKAINKMRTVRISRPSAGTEIESLSIPAENHTILNECIMPTQNLTFKILLAVV